MQCQEESRVKHEILIFRNMACHPPNVLHQFAANLRKSADICELIQKHYVNWITTGIAAIPISLTLNITVNTLAAMTRSAAFLF